MTEYTTKDSGKREEYSTGMRRDTQEGKPNFYLCMPLDVPYEEQLMTRFAGLMGRGAEKYGQRNWELSATDEELQRFKASAFRHFMQWINGETDEDHAAAVLFNITAVERLKYLDKKDVGIDFDMAGKPNGNISAMEITIGDTTIREEYNKPLDDGTCSKCGAHATVVIPNVAKLCDSCYKVMENE